MPNIYYEKSVGKVNFARTREKHRINKQIKRISINSRQELTEHRTKWHLTA